jgi:cell division protease FtsH
MLHVAGHEPLHKVTIIPRGRALGLTMSLPERDRYSMSLKQIKAMIASFFGGRVAEELTFGPEAVTTGASNDIQRATELARKLVTEYGFSDKLGPLRYNENQEEIFLGHSVTQTKNISETTATLIDAEVRRFVEEGEATARDILIRFGEDLETIAKGLLEYETLSRDDIETLIRGEAIIRPDGTRFQPRETPRRSSVPSSGGPAAGGPGFGPEPEPRA